MMESLLRDFRIAIRGLTRNPGFTAAAVITLALGIGATTSVFSVVYGVLLRPLPFPGADRFVEIVQGGDGSPDWRNGRTENTNREQRTSKGELKGSHPCLRRPLAS